MAERANQRIAYYNGSYVPEMDVRVPYRDPVSYTHLTLPTTPYV